MGGCGAQIMTLPQGEVAEHVEVLCDFEWLLCIMWAYGMSIRSGGRIWVCWGAELKHTEVNPETNVVWSPSECKAMLLRLLLGMKIDKGSEFGVTEECYGANDVATELRSRVRCKCTVVQGIGSHVDWVRKPGSGQLRAKAGLQPTCWPTKELWFVGRLPRLAFTTGDGLWRLLKGIDGHCLRMDSVEFRRGKGNWRWIN